MSTKNTYDQESSEEKIAQGDAARLSEAMRQLISAKKQVAEDESQLEASKEILKNLEQKVVPEMMLSMDCSQFKSAGGLTVTIKKHVKASINDTNREEACAWLRNNNYGRMIKSEIKLSLDKRATEEHMDQVVAALDAVGVPYTNKESVHPGTLSKFVREMDAEGDTIPEGTFKMYRFDQAVIKL